MRKLRQKIHKRNNSNGLETIEFIAVFMIFMGLTLIIVQVFFWFANSVAVNTALTSASQKTSARGGLTLGINNKFMDSLPSTLCGTKSGGGSDPETCSSVNNNQPLTARVYDPSGNLRSNTHGCSTGTVAIGEECGRFGDRIDLIVNYSQPFLFDYSCVAGASSCNNTLPALDFKQKLAVGSQSIVGQNK